MIDTYMMVMMMVMVMVMVMDKMSCLQFKIFHLPWERMRCGLFTIEDLLPRQLWRDLRFSTNILIPVFLGMCDIPREVFKSTHPCTTTPPTRNRKMASIRILSWDQLESTLAFVSARCGSTPYLGRLGHTNGHRETFVFPLFLSELLDVLFPLLVAKIVQLQIVKTLFASANHLCRCSWCCQSFLSPPIIWAFF